MEKMLTQKLAQGETELTETNETLRGRGIQQQLEANSKDNQRQEKGTEIRSFTKLRES